MPTRWPADRVERWPIEKLTPYARNARTHSDEQVAQIAASMREWGWTNPVLVDETGLIIAGHGRVSAARRLGWAEVPVMVATGWSEAQKRAYTLADNKLAMNADWDPAMLALELGELGTLGVDLGLAGFTADEIDRLTSLGTPGRTDPDEVPETPAEPVTQPGDVWVLGRHRVMCGDSTCVTDVERLMAGATAGLLHADPPYGMGKEADGVANDNLYGEQLDRFQREWWSTYRTFLDDNASAYIWGNAPDLWRLWYCGGLGQSEKFELRNEIVWDKKSIAGMASPDLTQYPMATERCLFFQFGNQFLGNINADDFPETWEPVRAYMEGEAKAAGIKSEDIKRVCGCGMYSHWFTRSQFTLIPEKHYRALAAEYTGRFVRPWSELKAAWDRVKGAGREVINGKLDGVRSYFDNAHGVMYDVWDFARVTGDERHGHATPKPVALMERVIRSSLPSGGLCVDPFGGSGSTLIACEREGRTCYTMELQAAYVDVAVVRWQSFTGGLATLEGDGRSFDQLKPQRRHEAR